MAVDWADLVTLDFAQYDLPGGKEKLAEQLKDAVHKIGRLIVDSLSLSLSLLPLIPAGQASST